MSFLAKKIKKVKFKILIIALALFIFSDHTHGVVVDIQGLNYVDIFSVRVYCGVNDLFHLKNQCISKAKNLSNIVNNYDISKIDTASLEEKLLALQAQLNSLQNQPDRIQYMPYGILSVGPQGPQGPAGPQGVSGLNQYVYVPTGGGTTAITNSLTFSTSTNTLVSNVNGISSSVFLNTSSPCIATGTGTNNTCYGEGALQQNTTGSENTSLGYYSGNNITSGSNNITLGANTNVYSPTTSGQLNIGNALFGFGLSGSLSSPSGILSVGTSSISSLSTGGNRGLIIDSGISNTSGLRLTNIAASSSVPANSYILGSAVSWPTAITMDSAGNIYTANLNSDNVTKITPEGVSTIIGTTGVFPSDIVTDSFGNIYVTNSHHLANNVTKITPSGVVSILGTTGNNPTGIAIDSAGNIYTANYDDDTVTPSLVTTGGPSFFWMTTVFPFGPSVHATLSAVHSIPR
jgi:hypothetical protein